MKRHFAYKISALLVFCIRNRIQSRRRSECFRRNLETKRRKISFRSITVDGKVVSRQRGQISKDGKTGTFRVDSTDGQGRRSPEVYFYDKQ